MDNRVLARGGARELSQDEMTKVAGGIHTVSAICTNVGPNGGCTDTVHGADDLLSCPPC
jgi:hypothetical protein